MHGCVKYRDGKKKRFQNGGVNRAARYDTMEKMRSQKAKQQFDHRPYAGTGGNN